MCLSQVFLDRILLFLVHILRECSPNEVAVIPKLPEETDAFFQFVVELAKLG